MSQDFIRTVCGRPCSATRDRGINHLVEWSRRIDRAPDGKIRLRIPGDERALLREVADELTSLLASNDHEPALERLFPSAYEDAEREREFRELTRAQLESGREQAFRILRRTVDEDSLSAEEADAWLRALNDARLVLGTRADVTEDLDWNELDPSNPRAPDLAVYAYLSWIQEELVEATLAG